MQSRCPYVTSKGRNRKRMGGLMTISPLWHLGHKCGSMPVVAVIDSRVFLYSITSGGHTFKFLRIDFKLSALNRDGKNLQLTLRCSVRDTRKSNSSSISYSLGWIRPWKRVSRYIARPYDSIVCSDLSSTFIRFIIGWVMDDKSECCTFKSMSTLLYIKMFS